MKLQGGTDRVRTGRVGKSFYKGRKPNAFQRWLLARERVYECSPGPHDCLYPHGGVQRMKRTLCIVCRVLIGHHDPRQGPRRTTCSRSTCVSAARRLAQ